MRRRLNTELEIKSNKAYPCKQSNKERRHFSAMDGWVNINIYLNFLTAFMDLVQLPIGGHPEKLALKNLCTL